MAATPRRAPACESTLVGADWNEACVRAAMDELSRDYAPLDDLRASAAYRARVAANLLYRFYLETRPVDPLPSQQTRVFAERGAGP